jgi:hypothetical protein
MSWHGMFVVVKDASVEDLASAGWHPAGPPITADEASLSSFEGVAAVEIPTGILLIHPLSDRIDLGTQLAGALSVEAVTAAFSGTADTYEWGVDGPGVARRWIRSGDEVLIEEGEPVPEETGEDRLDEDSLWRMLTARTGLPDDWLEREAQPIAPTPVAARPQAPPPAPPPQPSLWQRLTGRGRG